MTGTDAAGAAAGQCGRVLLIHRYYWPDTPPYATLLHVIAKRWRDDGHLVEVLAGQPAYKAAVENEKRPALDSVDGISVRRMALPSEAGRPIVRMLNALRMSLAVAWRVLVGSYDAVMISTVPQVVGAFSAAVAARLSGTRFLYHCMDLHPEIGRLSGEFSNGLVFRVLLAMDCFTCRTADPVVVLSEDMRTALRSRPGGEAFRIEVLNNFSLPAAEEAVVLPFEMGAGFTLLFAGNIGRFQGLEALVEAMALLVHRPDIELLMLGEGARREPLEALARAKGARVRFVGQHSVSVAKGAMKRCDAAFIGLSTDVYRYAYPSKTMTYLEQGCPLLVSVEPASCLARDVVEAGIGAVATSDSPRALADAILELSSDAATLQAMRSRAREFWALRYCEEAILDRWSELAPCGVIQ